MSDKLEQAERVLCDDKGQHQAETIRRAGLTVLAALKEAQEALRQISQGEGRFSRDPFEHACNTIEDMKGIANRALEPKR